MVTSSSQEFIKSKIAIVIIFQKVYFSTVHSIILLIDEIKVDIVKYKYKWISESINDNGIELGDIKDIAAMKLSAITGRGAKKDFIDLYFLLKIYDLKELIKFFQEKYKDGVVMLVLRSLTFFEDADEEATPDMCESINWDNVKECIKEKLKQYLKEI